MATQSRAVAVAGQSVAARPTLTAAVAAWRDALQLRARAGELAPTTVTTYAAGMARYASWAGPRAAGITADDIRAWMASERTHARPGSVRVWLAGIRAFCGWAVDAGLLPANPAGSIRAGRRRNSRRHTRDVISDSDVRRLLASIDTTTPGGLRDAAIVSLMVYTAVRSAEVARADVDDVGVSLGRMVIRVTGKGRDSADEVVVVAHPDAVAAIDAWMTARRRMCGRVGPLFTSLSPRTRCGRLSLSSIRRMVTGRMRAAGIAGVGATVTTHSLRHTAITSAIRHGAPITHVQSMARHQSLATTSIYIHAVARMDEPAEEFVAYDGVR